MTTEEELTPDRLWPLVYQELRRVAARHFAAAPNPPTTLQPTAIVHEVFVNLSHRRLRDFDSALEFRRLAARAMRRVLIDYARSKRTLRRGAGRRRVDLDEPAASPDRVDDLLDLGDSLCRFAKVHERSAEVVEMRLFGGMTEKEIAEVLGVTTRTVRDHWAFAKSWMRRDRKEDG